MKIQSPLHDMDVLEPIIFKTSSYIHNKSIKQTFIRQKENGLTLTGS